MVSAKDGDPSVHLAIQSLVRYLLQQELPEPKKKPKPEPKKIETEEEEFSSPLQETGEKEVRREWTVKGFSRETKESQES